MLNKIYYIFLLLAISLTVSAQKNAGLILTKASIPELRAAEETYPLWKKNTDALRIQMDAVLDSKIDVPVPVDPAGGYTHGQHKMNAKNLNQLGTAYQVFGEESYALYAKNLFMAYADVYHTFGEHPVKKSYAPGKLFWQQLNEAVWLVDAIQGYDAIYDYLTADERELIESKLLLPFADFLSVENTKVFNRIHNHGVWAVAAVGMTGIALENEELICRSLYGINEKGKPNNKKIDPSKLEAYEAGFFVQTKALFSPDGYYTEGPYYQRYAMTPFLLFAQSLDNNYPEVGSLTYRDGIFFKAVSTLIELTDAKGNLLPINDNLEGMNLNAPELIRAIDFLYGHTKEPSLLSIAENHNHIIINSLGLEVVKGLSNNLQEPLKQESKLITDGSDGKFGGIMLLRDTANEFCSVFKFASQGLTHGHYDRLNMFHYHNGNELFTDYGAARYVNIKSKDGGRYLPENKTYAKQTVAHNTLVVDKQSHFNFNYKEASKYHGSLIFESTNSDEIQVVAACDSNAYEGIIMNRVIATLNDESFTKPIVIDLFNVENTTTSSQYDLPFHFKGEVLSVDFEYVANDNMQKPMGDDHGYQHLWNVGSGKGNEATASFTWLANRYIYSLTTSCTPNTELLFGRIGANDPRFNLRSEPLFMVREKDLGNHTFASILECHGKQNPETEIVTGQSKQIENIEVLTTEKNYIGVSFSSTNGTEYVLLVNIEKNDSSKSHELKMDDINYQWEGHYTLIKK